MIFFSCEFCICFHKPFHLGDLQQEEKLRQQEHQLLAEEQARAAALIIQKQELEEKLASISKRTSGITLAFLGFPN